MKQLTIILLSIFFLTACDISPESSLGFTLPDGDVALGETIFTEFRCVDCHVIAGKPELSMRVDGSEPIMEISLGGKTRRVSTYGQLVTAIINPSHRASQEYWAAQQDPNIDVEMRNYNDIMSVTELVNLVAFIQSQYEFEPFTRTEYQEY